MLKFNPAPSKNKLQAGLIGIERTEQRTEYGVRGFRSVLPPDDKAKEGLAQLILPASPTHPPREYRGDNSH